MTDPPSGGWSIDCQIAWIRRTLVCRELTQQAGASRSIQQFAETPGKHGCAAGEPLGGPTTKCDAGQPLELLLKAEGARERALAAALSSRRASWQGLGGRVGAQGRRAHR